MADNNTSVSTRPTSRIEAEFNRKGVIYASDLHWLSGMGIFGIIAWLLGFIFTSRKRSQL